MLTLSIEHPDAEDFIDAKVDGTKVTGANISLRVTDNFMNAAKSNSVFVQQYPIGSENPMVKKHIVAKDLWDKMMYNSWSRAEPSILFWDTIIRESIPDCYADLGFKTISTNPCVVGDTLVKTDKGDLTVEEIVERFLDNEDFEILSYNIETDKFEYKKLLNALLTKHDADVINIKTQCDKQVTLTPDHKVYTEQDGWVEAQNLTIDHTLIIHTEGDISAHTFLIENIEVGQEDVYDLTVEDNHNFLANNVLIKNCGEIPLCAKDSCRLLAINLYSFVDKPFTPQASFDFEKFVKYTNIAQRLMDDIVEIELEKIDAILEKINTDPESDKIKSTEKNLWMDIKEKCKMGRRTGLGITAEGDMLAALGIRYGTKEATTFSTKVHKTLALSAYRSSVTMAQERGAFPIYESSREVDNPMIQRIKEVDEDLYNDMVKYGRRNIALLTIAPAGTTSMMTQTSSGFEPVFMVSYKRRRKINPNDTNVTVAFVDKVGDSWEEYNVFHHKFITWLEVNDYDVDEVTKMSQEDLDIIISQSPYHEATAHHVDWVEKIRMQGSIQKWVDHSISVTVNVPEDCTQEQVSEIYMTGWEHGCKGVTIYREGSRSGVLISNDDKKDKVEKVFLENNAPKRPKTLDAEVFKFNNNKEKWVAVIGLLDGRPYEIFTGKLDSSFSILSKVDSGWIVKQKVKGERARYDFQYEDSEGHKTTIEGLSQSFNKEYWNYAKLISGVLRHGMPLNFVVDMVNNLHLNEDTLNTWKKGTARALKRYIPDGTKAAGNTCGDCGEDALVYQEGCLTCKNCGYSKCG